MSRPYIIVAGLPVDHPAVPAHLHDIIRLGVEKSSQLMTAAGYEVQFCYTTPEPGGIEELVKALKARKPDGVVIGFGVRGNKGLSPLFEDMVNAVVEHAPGAKLMFNTTPEDSVEHAKRWILIERFRRPRTRFDRVARRQSVYCHIYQSLRLVCGANLPISRIEG